MEQFIKKAGSICAIELRCSKVAAGQAEVKAEVKADVADVKAGQAEAKADMEEVKADMADMKTLLEKLVAHSLRNVA